METTTYHLSYNRFTWLYLIFPFLFGFFAHSSWISTAELISTILIGSFVAILGAHFLFWKILYPAARIVVTETALETYGVSGKPNRIPFDQLVGPKEEHLWKIRRYTFQNMDKLEQKIVITNFTEHYDELVEQVKQRIASAHNHPTENA